MTRFTTRQPSHAPGTALGRPPVRTLPVALGLIAIVALAAGCNPAPGIARGEALFDTCAPCHGDDGAGDQELAAPAIAGAADWYLTYQLQKFQDGVRGYHYTDAEGLRMRPMSRALIADEDVPSIVEYVYNLPIPDPPATMEGDAEAGEAEYAALCANCHGIDGRGVDSPVPELAAPPLLHLSDWYMASTLRKYRDGVRGAMAGDLAGATMRAPMTGMSDERIDNVTAYVMTLQRLPRRVPGPPPEPLPELIVDASVLPEGVTVAMAQEGQEIFHGQGVCVTCHLRGGAGGALAPNLTDDVWLNIDGEYASIVDVVMTGVAVPLEHPGQMLPRAGTAISDDQVRAVAAYVYTLGR